MTRPTERFSRPLLAACLAACLALGPSGCGRDLARPDPGYEGMRVESFDLVDTANQPADETILDGHFTVVDFIFTNCPIYCPTMAVSMKRVQDATFDTDARLLSISVDGVNDTPEVLDAYADAIGADRSRWTFLTGDSAHVRALCEQQFLLGIQTDPGNTIKTANGEMDFIDHPTRLVLVGPDRGILGMYSYNNPSEIDALIARLRRIAE